MTGISGHSGQFSGKYPICDWTHTLLGLGEHSSSALIVMVFLLSNCGSFGEGLLKLLSIGTF